MQQFQKLLAISMINGSWFKLNKTKFNYTSKIPIHLLFFQYYSNRHKFL